MNVIEIKNDNLSWKYIRILLALSLLKRKPVRLTGSENFFNSSPEYIPVLDDVRMCVSDLSLGELSSDSGDLLYIPSGIVPGNYSIDTGKFSSAVEVILFLMPAFFYADYRSVFEIGGVTHSSLSQPTSFVKESLLNLFELTGHYAGLNLKRFGFYGSGGGSFEARVYPHEKSQLDDILRTGKKEVAGVKIFISGLTSEIAKRQKLMISSMLGIEENRVVIMEVMDSDGLGNSVQIFINTTSGDKVIPLVFSCEGRVYNSAGDFIYDESETGAEIEKLILDCSSYIQTDRWPDSLIYEALPLLRLSGMNTEVPDDNRELQQMVFLMEKLGL